MCLNIVLADSHVNIKRVLTINNIIFHGKEVLIPERSMISDKMWRRNKINNLKVGVLTNLISAVSYNEEKYQ